jgi:hypothetical protein
VASDRFDVKKHAETVRKSFHPRQNKALKLREINLSQTAPKVSSMSQVCKKCLRYSKKLNTGFILRIVS